MELHEAFKRIFRVHRKLILLCLIAGIGISFVARPGSADKYAASSRLVLDTSDPTSEEAAAAIADTGRAIVTSRSRVIEALAVAGVRRDIAEVIDSRISVVSLGSSGVLQLTVIDPDPRVAAEVANALTGNLIGTRLESSRGRLSAALGEIDARLELLRSRVAGLDRRIARSRDPERALSLARDRDVLVHQQLILEQERADLIAVEADRPTASIIDRAVPPAEPLPSHRLSILALGALLGLTVGIGIAVFIEAYHPTIVGGHSLARELEAPLLDDLPRPPDRGRSVVDLSPLATSLRLAASTAGVGTIRLVGTDRRVDLGVLRDWLRTTLRSSGNGSAPIKIGTLVGTRGGGFITNDPISFQYRLSPNGDEEASSSGPETTGMVVVAPSMLPKETLTPVRDLFAITGWPLLGIVTYRPRPVWLSGKDRARPAQSKTKP